MTTLNAYLPEIVNLAGGLDFVTPKPSVAPGALTDCFNYEVADALGYKRVDGVERFDGRPSISYTQGLYYTSDCSPDLPADGECLYLDGDSTQEAFAVVLSSDTDKINYYVFNTEKFLTMYVGTLDVKDTTGNTYTLSNTIYNWHSADNTTIQQMIDGMNSAYTNDAEPLVTKLSSTSQGDGGLVYPAIGLQFFKDQLYAVMDFDSVIFENVTEQIFPGDTISNSGAAGDIIVRDVQIISGTYGAGDAVVKVSFSWADVGDYNIASKRYTFTPAATIDITRGATTLTNVGEVGTSTTVLSNRMAGIFRSWGIDTLPNGSLYTDQGWQEIDLGYIANFAFTGQNSGQAFTRAGRESQPSPSTLSNIVVGQSAVTGNTSTGNPGSLDHGEWRTGVSGDTLAQCIATINDGKSVGVYLPSQLIPGQGSQTLAIGGWDFSELPSDAFISGIKIEMSASAPASSTSTITVTPYSNSLTTTVAKKTARLGAVTTTGTFTVAAVGATQSVTITNTAGVALNNTVYIADGSPSPSHSIYGTVTNIVGTTITVETTEIVTGSAGDTMGTSAAFIVIQQLGGEADLWSSPNITPSVLLDPTFVLNISAVGQASHAGGTFIGMIRMTVYYQPTSSVYYFWNGTDDVQGVISTYTISSGDFATNTAAGIIQIANVQPYSTAARANILDGDQIRSAPGGAGNCFGTISGDVLYAGLPTLQMLLDNNSRYEFMVANFFGNQDWSAIYGCSGAGRAFTYDGLYFRYIFTGLNATLDLPRHLAFHNFHLCLGYSTGAVLSSVAGDPESYDGTLGAAEFDTGDPITGLMRMNGTTLGLFCRNSIQGLNGTDNTNFSTNVLSPSEGAIEYTVVDCGKPVYASYKGISTFDQTNAYGNFLGNRLSANITPWLLSRLTNTPVPIETQLFPLGHAQPSTQGITFAMPIRNKNQCRFYFKDGFCLTLTFMGSEATPVFTLQQMAYSLNDHAFVLIPFAHSSAVDSTGRDRNHITMFNSIDRTFSASDDYQYVWELDRGWGFGSQPIQAYFITAHNFFNNPLDFDDFRKLRLHGQSRGACTIKASVSSNYGITAFQYGPGYTVASLGPPPIPTTRNNAPPQDISLPRTGFEADPYTFTSDLQPQTNLANFGKRGRSFSIQFVSDPESPEPPHAAQALMIQITENKGDV